MKKKTQELVSSFLLATWLGRGDILLEHPLITLMLLVSEQM